MKEAEVGAHRCYLSATVWPWEIPYEMKNTPSDTDNDAFYE